MMRSKQRGFTLIELVVVIIILGILAAFAVPKFMGLEGQARVAAVKSIGGSMEAADTMAHGIWEATSAPVSPLTIEGQAITFVIRILESGKRRLRPEWGGSSHLQREIRECNQGRGGRLHRSGRDPDDHQLQLVIDRPNAGRRSEVPRRRGRRSQGQTPRFLPVASTAGQ